MWKSGKAEKRKSGKTEKRKNGKFEPASAACGFA